jgi:hypothetical protein
LHGWPSATLATSRELQRQARGFCEQLNELLNGTVVDGPVLTTVTTTSSDKAWIGYRIARNEVVPTEAMALTISAAPPKAFLHVYHVLTLESDTGYLTTARSDAALYMDSAMDECFCRYDYEREKPDGYPEAHLHVYAETDAIDRCSSTDKELRDLHFPVGGRRFRPTLEDLIGFLVREGIAQGKPGWEDVVARHRRRYYKIQLAAAVRRDPETARAMLARIDAEGR